MPSPEEFQAAAQLFDESAEAVRKSGARPEHHFGPHVMRGGRLTFSVDDLIGRNKNDTGRAATQLAQLANEARKRAAIAEREIAAWEAYESKYRAYESAHSEYMNGRRSSAPVAPAAPRDTPAWVDLSGTAANIPAAVSSRTLGADSSTWSKTPTSVMSTGTRLITSPPVAYSVMSTGTRLITSPPVAYSVMSTGTRLVAAPQSSWSSSLSYSFSAPSFPGLWRL